MRMIPAFPPSTPILLRRRKEADRESAIKTNGDKIALLAFARRSRLRGNEHSHIANSIVTL